MALRPRYSLLYTHTHPPQKQEGKADIKFAKWLQIETGICPSLGSKNLEKSWPTRGTKTRCSLLLRGACCPRRRSALVTARQKRVWGCTERWHVPAPHRLPLPSGTTCTQSYLARAAFSRWKRREYPSNYEKVVAKIQV